jgi:hypothetical protein
MGLVKKIASAMIWIVIILAQIVVSFIAGEITFSIGQGQIPASVLFMWLGTTFGIFLIGLLPISLKRSLSPKKYFARLTFTALGVLIPLSVISTFGYALNADKEIIGSGLDFFNFTDIGVYIFIFSAPVLGVFGFYVPNWISREKIPLRLIGIVFLLPLSYLFLLGYVQGYFLPDYYYIEILSQDNIKYYTINPKTILESINQGESNAFSLSDRQPDDDIERIWSAGTFSWGQEDYLKIANALHEFTWNDSLENWQVIRAHFWMDQCQNMKSKFDHAQFYFYQSQGDSNVVHEIWIAPLYEEVGTDEITYYRTGKWKGFDLNNVKINSADMALLIAEEKGGIEARTKSNNKCNRVYVDLEHYTKYDLFTHPFNLYDWGWEVRYWFNEYSDFGVNIDPYTGKYYKP